MRVRSIVTVIACLIGTLACVPDQPPRESTLEFQVVVTDWADTKPKQDPEQSEGIVAARCLIPVSYPSGSHNVTAFHDGVAMDVGWDRARSVGKVTDGKVEFKNLSWHVKNVINLGRSGTNFFPKPVTMDQVALGPEYHALVSFCDLCHSSDELNDIPELKDKRWTIRARLLPYPIKLKPIGAYEAFLKSIGREIQTGALVEAGTVK